MSKNSNLESHKNETKIIKLIFAFFSISLLLFGGNTLMITYGQPQQHIPPQANQQAQQQEDQQDLLGKLQQLQRVQKASELGSEEAEDEITENATRSSENATDIFTYATEIPSIKDMRKIQIATPPGSKLRAEVLGPGALGTPLAAAIGNSTSNGNLTSIANLTFANLSSIANLKPFGNMTGAIANMTASINALNPTTTDPVNDSAGSWSGCHTGLWGRVHPEWVPVRPTRDSLPWTDPVNVTGSVTYSRVLVNYEEFPFSHHSHDRTFHMALDPQYINLDSTRQHDEIGSLETEWEIGHSKTGVTDRFPKEFWPWEGDRVWEMGRWVIDCGHFSTSIIGYTPPPDSQPIYYHHNYKTEIHPPFITAFTRIEPFQFPGDTNPSIAAVTYIWVHGRGGNHDTPVGGQNYEFDIPMPPRSPIVTVGPLRYVDAGHLGGDPPILTGKPAENKAHVVVPLLNVPASPDLRYGAIVASKWLPIVTHPSQAFRTLKVTFDYIHVNEDHDIGSGEWKNLWVGVNGKWIELSGPNGHYGLNDADNGDTFTFPAGSKTVTVIVPENGELKMISTGWESDQDSCYLPTSAECTPGTLADVNNPIGHVRSITNCSRNFDAGGGEHIAVSLPYQKGDDETDGDYFLYYHIDELNRTTGTTGPCSTPIVSVPNVVGLTKDNANQTIINSGLTPNFTGIGETVDLQNPHKGTLVEPKHTVTMHLKEHCPHC
jgi:PASTA domain